MRVFWDECTKIHTQYYIIIKSVVSIATAYGLEDRGVGVQVPVKSKKQNKAIPVTGLGGL
jgi:hypothetical protein